MRSVRGRRKRTLRRCSASSGGEGPTAGVALSPEEFEGARAEYYALSGCDPATGYPTRERLERLGLGWLADA